MPDSHKKLEFVDGPGDSYFFTVDSVCRALVLSEQERKRMLLEVGKEGWDAGYLVTPDGIDADAIIINKFGLRDLLRNRPVLLIERPGLARILGILEGRRDESA